MCSSDLAIWEFAATGVASAVYDGDNTPTGYQAPSTTTGVSIPNGYSTLRITGLPKSTNLKIRITLKNDNTAELWLVDDFKVTGYTGSFISPFDNYTVAGTSQVVSGLTYNTNYYYRVRGVGANSTSLNSNTINVATEAGFATLSAPSVSSITNNSAILGATVLTPGSGGVLFDRGTVYSTTSTVTSGSNALSEGGTAVASFSHTRSSLSPETRYYYAGYATNSYGTGLSSTATFLTLSKIGRAHV